LASLTELSLDGNILFREASHQSLEVWQHWLVFGYIQTNLRAQSLLSLGSWRLSLNSNCIKILLWEASHLSLEVWHHWLVFGYIRTNLRAQSLLILGSCPLSQTSTALKFSFGKPPIWAY
jgi:hypothetical protein